MNSVVVFVCLIIIWQFIKLFFEMKKFSNIILKLLKIVVFCIDFYISMVIVYYSVLLMIFWLMSYNNYKYLDINDFYILSFLMFFIVFYLLKYFFLFNRKTKNITKQIFIISSSVIETVILLNNLQMMEVMYILSIFDIF